MTQHRNLSMFAVAVVLALAAVRPANSDERPLYFPGTPAEIARVKQFDALLQQRSQPQVAGQTTLASQLLPFLDDSFVGLRIRAAQALGEIADPIAREPLEERLALMTDVPFSDKRWIDPLTLQLALGRIAARSLHGQDKIDAALSYTKYKWPDVVAASKVVNAADGNRLYEYTDSDIIVAFAVDLLYEMGKSGEPTDASVGQLTLSDAQKVYLRAALVSNKEEVQLEMAFLVDPEDYIYRKDALELIKHLVTLKPEITQALLSRLEDMKAHPDEYYGTEPYPGYPGAFRRRMNYAPLLTIVALSHDPAMVPYLKYFQQSDNPGVAKSATAAINAIEGFKPETVAPTTEIPPVTPE